jgi:GNAT superfamily N-acetyltransferase
LDAAVQQKAGRVPFVRRLLSAGRRLLYHKQEFYLCEADCSVDLPELDPGPYVVRTAGPEDLPLLESLVTRAKLAQFRTRLERGEVCAVALRDGRAASYVWVTPSDHRDPWLKVTVPVDDDACVGYDAYTHPDFRGQGVRKLLHVDERRRVALMGRHRLVFWLERDVFDRATRTWDRIGLRHDRVGTIVSHRFLRRLVFTKLRRYPTPRSPATH